MSLKVVAHVFGLPPEDINYPLFQWATEQRCGGPRQKLVLMVLSALSDKDGCIMITRAELAEWTSIRGRTLVSAINALRHLGYLEYHGDAYAIIQPDEPPLDEGERVSLWINHELREKVYARDGWACVECGAGDRLQIDHITPQALGGFHDIDNLQTLCAGCNQRKSCLAPPEWEARRRKQ